MSKEPKRNIYVGHRYVPKIMGEWDKEIQYEGLSIVTYQGTSYTSKKHVPVGIDISNEEFWTVTGNYNAQVETYRRDVKTYKEETDQKIDNYEEETDQKIDNYKEETDQKIDNYEEETDQKIDNYKQETTEQVEAFNENLTEQLAQTTQTLNDLFLNVTNVPEPLEPILFDGTDETIKLQNILDYAGLNRLNVFIPAGTVYIGAIYVPNNVYLRGAGKYKTTLRLPDDFEGVNTRHPTGIMTKKNVDFYRVGHLTYDGNALNNVVLDDLGTKDHLNYQSNGLCNFYNASPVADDGHLPEDQYAKDFIYEEVYVKEVIRNGLLIGGQANKRGTVLNVTIENAYLDHHIYETNTNTDVDYTNIEFKGTTRGSYIVTQGGTFNNLDFKVLKKNSHYDRNGIVNVRARDNMDKQAIFNNVSIRTDFEDMNQIFLVQKNRENDLRGGSLVVNNIEITQTDNVQQGMYGQPVTLVESGYGEKIHFTGVRVFNAMAFRLLYALTSTEDVKLEDVSVHYSEDRTNVLKEDSVIAFVNEVNKDKTYKNIRLKNVVYHGIAPTLFNFREASSEPVVIDGLHIEDSFFKSNGSENLNHMDVATLVTVKNFWFKHSIFNNYIGNTISNKTILDYGLQLEDVIFNDRSSRCFIDIYVAEGISSKTLDYDYVYHFPRKVNVLNLSSHEEDKFITPNISFQNNEITVSVNKTENMQRFFISSES